MVRGPESASVRDRQDTHLSMRWFLGAHGYYL
jgi:hypothetical protein